MKKKNQGLSNIFGKGTKLVYCLIFIGLVSVGCSGNHQSDGSMATGLQEGVFLDSAVQGLKYRTATRSGMTDEKGTFTYMDGETVTFSIGDVMMGQAKGKSTLTPVDLVSEAVDETHPTVTNMCRFLQTLDEDSNPENGIVIPEMAIQEIEGRDINFAMNPEDFGNDADVEMFMDAYGAMKSGGTNLMMVSTEDARAHMRSTMLEMMQGNVMMKGQDHMM